MVQPGSQPSRDRILHLLKVEGPRTASQLSDELGMTPMGARQHLAILHEEGLVRSREERRTVGRPAHVWSLSARAHERFADSHGALAVELIESMQAAFGEEGMNRLLGERLQSQISRYRRRLDGMKKPGERVDALCQLRNEEGYMAESWQADGVWYLAENHCPICEAAESCPGLCRNELELFQQCLGATCEIERVEHILDGQRRCVYRIQTSA
jgi:predicted ArsR family transcriptional regulator